MLAVVIYHGVHDERREPKRFYKISRAQRVGASISVFPCKSVRFVGHLFPLIFRVSVQIREIRGWLYLLALRAEILLILFSSFHSFCVLRNQLPYAIARYARPLS